VDVRGITDNAANSFVALSEQYPKDLNDLLDSRNDEDVRERWLAAARTLSEAPAREQSPEAKARLQKVAQKAMEVTDPEEADRIIKRGMAKAVRNSQAKRRELKKLIHGPHHFLKGPDKKKEEKTTTDKPQHDKNEKEVKSTTGKPEHAHHTMFFKKKTTTTKNAWQKMFGEKKTTTQDPGNPMGEHNAQCVFNVLSATNSMAALGANLNDVSKTCKYVKPKDFFGQKHSPATVHAKVCEVNVFAVLAGIVGLMTSLANSADSCAATLVPNVDAKCSAAVTGLVTAVSQMGGSFTLVGAACSGHGWYGDIPKDRFPHNVGSNEIYERDYLDKKRLLSEAHEVASEEAAGPAPPRQLLFGGGKGSTATQCATEIMSVMWSLASAGLAINDAGNVNNPGCPPTNLWGETDPKLKGIVYEVSQGQCAVNIESVITSFLGVIAILQLVAVNCLDTLNIRAICGAGVAGIFAGASGIAQAGTGLWLVCDTLQTEPIHTLITAVRGIDAQTGLITNTMTGDSSGVFGRRLAEAEGHARNSIEDLKKRFATPEDAWKSIGYDMNNASAAFRKVHLPEPDFEAFASLVEEPEASGEGGAGLFGSQQTCSD